MEHFLGEYYNDLELFFFMLENIIDLNDNILLCKFLEYDSLNKIEYLKCDINSIKNIKKIVDFLINEKI